MGQVERFIRSFPKKKKLEKNDIDRQVIHDLPPVPAFLRDSDDGNVISGDIHDEAVEEGSLDEIHEDLDVCVYTDVSVGNLGLVGSNRCFQEESLYFSGLVESQEEERHSQHWLERMEIPV